MKRHLPFLRGQHSVWGYLTLLLLACGPSVEHPPRSTAHAPVQPSSASSGSDADTRTSSTISSWKTGSAQTEAALAALDRGTYVTFRAEPGSFPLVSKGRAAPWVIADGDFPGVRRVVKDLQRDIKQVTGTSPELVQGASLPRYVVLFGTLGRHRLIDTLVQKGKLDVSAIHGRWETHLITVVEKPFPGVDQAMVVVGSDQRGSIYGAYDVSRQIGVSPWYFWDDVPTPKQASLFVKRGRFSQGEPVVKYRGFFINDEEPQLGRWARATFGPAPNPKAPHGFHHHLYAHVYEVLLRLKGNYLWPAVWGRSLFDDDPKNQEVASEYGIVLGTSHEAPMMRAQDEWNRYGAPTGPYGGTGDFSFVRNQSTIEQYWADGLRRMGGSEGLITVGMRGNGDTEMEDAAGTELMLRVVQRQREIIREVLDVEPEHVPQVWTLYKEVQDYWDAGMRAPDDVTIIWCDDNWGNMRKLPNLNEPMRSGGYGLYYHFDYVGGGRNYKWVDTTSLPNLWEQLHLSYRYGVDRVWMTNVGDLKNNEVPLEFFLDYAWNPESLPLQRLRDWQIEWARAQFGQAHAGAVADLLRVHGKLQSRRKPELLNRRITLDERFDLRDDKQLDQAVLYTDESPFSLIHYREAERVVLEWSNLRARSEEVRSALDPAYADAYYQLVHYAIAATANAYELRMAQFKNRLYAEQKRSATHAMGEAARTHFERDQAMSHFYNEELAGGKWRHWQSQPKFGYGGPYPNSSWQQPEKENQATDDFIWPELKKVHIPRASRLAVAVEGYEELWPGPTVPPRLSEFSPYQTQPAQYIEVVNLGQIPFHYRVETEPWLIAEPAQGEVIDQVRVEFRVDWERAPLGRSEAHITVRRAGQSPVEVRAPLHRPADLAPRGFVEANGVVSIEAENYDRAVDVGPIGWKWIPDIGRTAGGMTPFPVTASRREPGPESPRLEYDFHTFSTGEVTVWVYLSPRNNVLPSDGLKYALSLDDESPQIVNITKTLNGIPMNRSWERNTSDNVARLRTRHKLERKGAHTLKVWMVDPTVIVQKIIIDMGGLRPSYLGPPESYRTRKRQ